MSYEENVINVVKYLLDRYEETGGFQYIWAASYRLKLLLDDAKDGLEESVNEEVFEKVLS